MLDAIMFICENCGEANVVMSSTKVLQQTDGLEYVGLGKCTSCQDSREYLLTRSDFLELNRDRPRRTSSPPTPPQRVSFDPNVTPWVSMVPDFWDEGLKEAKDQVGHIFHQWIRPSFKRYHHREIQIALAAHITLALRKRKVLLAEAGVGTGKTFAYLVPLIWQIRHTGLLRGPVIISTKTNNLIGQLVSEDIPQADKALARPISVFEDGEHAAESASIQGQQHYACLLRINSSHKIKRGFKDRLTQWVLSSGAGLRGEDAIPDMTEDQWESINITECRLHACPERDLCPYLRLRDNLNSFKGIIVTNHNLLALNLINRAHQRQGYWRTPQAIVIDEAHAFEEAVRQQMSSYFSRSSFDRLFRLAEDFEDHAPQELPGLSGRVEAILKLADDLFNHVTAIQEKNYSLSTFRTRVRFDNDFSLAGESLKQVVYDAREELWHWNVFTQTGQDQNASRAATRLTNALDRLHRDLTLLLRVVRGGDRTYVAWMEDERPNTPRLVIAPVWVDTALDEILWNNRIPVILLSATLVSNRGFAELGETLGLGSVSHRLKTFLKESSFDYQNRVRIYVPDDIPHPRTNSDNDDDQSFTSAIKSRIADLLKLTGGRSLVLFTSHARMNEVHQYLAKQELGFRVLVQRPGNVYRTLREFASEETSVLLATGSFWEGVDVEGPSLSHVIMDKLPFPVPTDPLTEAKQRLAGPNWFQKVFVPVMFTQLRQGAGRLIRSEHDWGIISLLDPRARGNYYETVLSALPKAPWIDDIDTLRMWFNHQSTHFGER